MPRRVLFEEAAAASYRSLLDEHTEALRSLKLMNAYAAQLAGRLCSQQFNCQECRAGKPDGQPDAPSLRTWRGTHPKEVT